MRNRHLGAFGLGLLLLLVACQRPHPVAPAPQTVRIQTPSTAQRRAQEAHWLSAFPELGTRNGPTLVLRYGDAEVGRYDDDPKGCDPYSISKVIQLYDTASGRPRPVAELTCHFGDMDNRYLVLPTSEKYAVRDDVTAAPDGRTLAMGDNALGPTAGDFTLIQWPDMTRIAGFKAGCRNVTWQAADRLSAVCWHNDGSSPQDPDDSRTVFFAADIRRDESGQWRMTATNFVDSSTGKPMPAAARPLPSLTAEVPLPDRP